MGDIAGVKEHGMLFKAEMVRARQDGRKTQTRRNITFDNSITDPRVRRDEWHELRWAEAAKGREYPGPKVIIPFWHVPFRDIAVRVYPRIQPGDVIWVREKWADLRGMGFGNNPITSKPFEVAYGADTEPGSDGDRVRLDYGVKWRSSMLMPRWASRTDLDVIRVGSQRVQEISHDDTCAEGIDNTRGGESACRNRFQSLWDSINAAKGFGWDVNHPVWIYEWPAK